MANDQAQDAHPRRRRRASPPVPLGAVGLRAAAGEHAGGGAVELARERAAGRWRSSISACRPIPTARARDWPRSRRCASSAPDTKVIIATGNENREHALREHRRWAPMISFRSRSISTCCASSSSAPSVCSELEAENRRLAAVGAALADRRHSRRAATAWCRLLRMVEKIAADRRGGPAPGRERHRQGTAGAGHPSPERARQGAVRRHQLRRHPGNAARERALRPRERRVHRRRAPDHRQDREGRQGHALPRRDRRSAARHAGEAAALPAGPGHRAHRRPPADPRRCPHRLRHQPEPRPAHHRRPVPRGSLLPPQRGQAEHSAAARARRRRAFARELLPQKVQRAVRTQPQGLRHRIR